MRNCRVITCLLLIFSTSPVCAGQFDPANYPFNSARDMVSYNYRCEQLLAGLKLEQGQPGLQRYLILAHAFSSTQRALGEQYTIVSFAKSSDPALVKLRTEIGLPPPPGGAIVRIYPSKDQMPQPIARLFDDPIVNGVTWSHRFIAVISDDHSDEQVRNAVSHELVHACMSSRMGAGFDELPKWFIEGTALYIAGGKVLYVYETPEGQRNLSWTPQEYNEYRTVFKYLQWRLGKQRVSAFIKDCVARQSADEPLHSLGIEDYDALKAQALHWDAMRQVKLSGLMIGIVAIGLIALWLVHRRAPASDGLEALEELPEYEEWE